MTYVSAEKILILSIFWAQLTSRQKTIKEKLKIYVYSIWKKNCKAMKPFNYQLKSLKGFILPYKKPPGPVIIWNVIRLQKKQQLTETKRSFQFWD